MQEFDLVVIGSGPGGYVGAIRAAQLGLKTAIVEKDSTLGGTCLNIGCIPSKALLESSELFHVARERMKEHGIQTGDVALDLPTMMKRKERIVKELTDGVAFLMKKNKITTLTGTGRLAAKDKVVVEAKDGTTELKTKNVMLATGSAPIELPFLKFDKKHVISSTEALSLDAVPEHLVVVGAGAVGLEMGSVWRRLGAKVTVIEMLPRAAPFSDEEVGKALERALKRQGLDFRFSTQVTAAEIKGGTVTLSCMDKNDKTETITGDKVLVAVGRRPYSDGLGLDEVGVETNKRGFVAVDEHYRTSVSSIYAIGDLIGGAMLAHKAEDEGMAVAEIIAGKPGHVDYMAIPNIIYTNPELAQVGWTEAQVKEKGIDYRTGSFLFRANGRAKTLGETDGLVKFIADKSTDRLLGVHIVGPRASELIAELALAIEFRGSAEDVALTCHPHPTLTEAIREAALAVGGRAIHS